MQNIIATTAAGESFSHGTAIDAVAIGQNYST